MWALISSSGYIYFYMDAKLDIFYFDFLIFFHLEMRKKNQIMVFLQGFC